MSENLSASGANRPDPSLFIHGRRLVSLCDLALSVVVRNLDKGAPNSFTQWKAEVVGLAGQMGLEVSGGEVQWLWQTIRHEPRFAASHSGGFIDDHLAKREVLPRGSLLVIRLGDKAKERAEDPKPEVVLLHPLFMGERRRGRAECFDVQAEVRMRVKPKPVADEAVAMGIEDKTRIQVEAHMLRVQVDSLNEAYAKASQRLETWRRTFGGSVYEHLFWVRKSNDQVPLDRIREEVELGTWELPPTPEGPE